METKKTCSFGDAAACGLSCCFRGYVKVRSPDVERSVISATYASAMITLSPQSANPHPQRSLHSHPRTNKQTHTHTTTQQCIPLPALRLAKPCSSTRTGRFYASSRTVPIWCIKIPRLRHTDSLYGVHTTTQTDGRIFHDLSVSTGPEENSAGRNFTEPGSARLQECSRSLSGCAELDRDQMKSLICFITRPTKWLAEDPRPGIQAKCTKGARRPTSLSWGQERGVYRPDRKWSMGGWDGQDGRLTCCQADRRGSNSLRRQRPVGR
ncbi:unnamed protein product [Protopolystoma xenopodis]|uniref:Uncharacterized protein n=1 Tax=Protopolystoma xenopodis TaxID=117903 RepID=A0A448XIQ8_9PLAT|nr:unnamed protein product [Protopolystoma xenopodis]